MNHEETTHERDCENIMQHLEPDNVKMHFRSALLHIRAKRIVQNEFKKRKLMFFNSNTQIFYSFCHSLKNEGQMWVFIFKGIIHFSSKYI